MNKNNKARNFMATKKANGTVTFIIGITVVVIVLVTVSIPTINAYLDDPNTSLSTAQKAILGAVVTLMIVLVLVLISNAM